MQEENVCLLEAILQREPLKQATESIDYPQLAVCKLENTFNINKEQFETIKRKKKNNYEKT